MSSNAKSSLSAVVLGLSCTLLIGAGSLWLGARTEAAGAGPPGGMEVLVINPPFSPVPVAGLVGAEQVGDWTVSLAGGISIDPSQNEVTVTNPVKIVKSTRRVARFELFLDDENPNKFFDIDARGSTKIRISFTVNTSGGRDVDVFLTSLLAGESFGSVLDSFNTDSGPDTRIYELPGEVVRFRAVMDDDDDDAFRQVIVTVWGD